MNVVLREGADDPDFFLLATRLGPYRSLSWLTRQAAGP